MPLRKRTSSVLNGDDPAQSAGGVEPTTDRDTTEPTGGDEMLSLAEQADAAEAEAAEADALAAAARARTRALRLRQQAEAAAKAAVPVEASAPAELDTPAEPDVVDANPDAVEAQPDVVDTEPDHEVESDAPVDADIAKDEEQPVRRRRLRVPHVSLKIAAATLVILLSLGLFGLSAFMIVHHRQVAAEQQRSAEFAAAARQGVVTLMSLDFNRAEEDVKRILDNTTGDFKKDFESQAPEFTQVAKESKVVTEATVNATAVDKMTRDTATVLVAVTTNVSNTASKEQQPRSWRLSVDVARDGGQIKLAKVEFVP